MYIPDLSSGSQLYLLKLLVSRSQLTCDLFIVSSSSICRLCIPLSFESLIMILEMNACFLSKATCVRNGVNHMRIGVNSRSIKIRVRTRATTLMNQTRPLSHGDSLFSGFVKAYKISVRDPW